MATAQLIDLSNYDTMLVQSTQGRAGTPDGNTYFDKASGFLEIFSKQEVPLVNLGSGLEDNPIDDTLGVRLEAMYAFENQERSTDEDLRKYDRWLEGNFKYAGAYNFVNGRKLSSQADYNLIRQSGTSEITIAGVKNKTFFGARGLGSILVSSQPYYQQTPGGAPTDFAKAGNFDELVEVFEDGVSDNRSYLAVSIRTFGQNYDRKESTTDLGISELEGYFSGFAVSETPHLTSGNYTLADVYGVGQIAPWTTMGLEELDTPVVISGFNEVDGTFTWVINNTAGSLDEVVAFLDALAQTDDDINDHITNVTNGKRVGTWYSYDAQGRIVTRSGADGNGLYIYNVPTADKQRVVFTDDGGNTKTYPFEVSVEAEIGATAKADVNAWYHSFFAAAYNTAGAITVQDSGASPVKGLASTADVNNKIIFPFDYDGDTIGGPAGTEKNCVFLCEGDGGATQAKTLYTITRQTTVAFACIPAVENNT